MQMRHFVLLWSVGVASLACHSPPSHRPPSHSPPSHWPPSHWQPQWRELARGSNASLRGLCAVDQQVAFCGGAGGTLMRTVDGGATWTDIAPPGSAACDFRDVEAFDRDHVVAMVAGQPARVYRSEDGGSSWRIVHEDPRPAAFFDALAFVGDYGLLFGDAIDGQFCLL